MSFWKLYYTSRDAWEAMLADCAAAKWTIDLEQYLFANDTIGREFVDLLIRKSKEGVRVRMLLDSAGSFGVFVSRIPAELMAAGVQIAFFNPISPWRVNNIFSWYFRDHRKIIVIDGKVAHVGGVCIEDIMADWRDTHLKIEDPVAEEVQESFDRMWAHVTQGARKSFPKPKTKSTKFSFFTNSPRFRERFIYHALIDAIRGATKSVDLTTPYFVPDARLFRVLRLAARRGAKVRLLVADPSDHAFVDAASHAYYRRMLRAGIRIFRYEHRRLHAKTGVIDGKWATVGTANLDNLSLLFNYEGNIVTSSSKMIADLSEQFEKDIADAREVLRHEWRHRPLFQKFLEKVMWPFHKFL